jgi:hypothetical protein
MSRTFKRPMFRKGGNVGVGIMSGITDREQYNVGSNPFGTRQDMEFAGMRSQNPELLEAITASKAPLPEMRKLPPIDIDTIVGDPKGIDYFIEQLREGAGEYGGLDPGTSFLLTAGPRIARAKSFSDLISKLDEPAQQLIKQADAKAKFERDLRLGGTKLGLDEERRLAERRSDLEFKNDERNYLNLKEEDRRIYDLAIAERAKNYNKMDALEKQQFDKEMEKRRELFELGKIKLQAAEQMKAVEAQIQGQKDIAKLKEDDPFSQKNLAVAYFKEYGSKPQAENRAEYEFNNIEGKIRNKFGDKNFGGLIGGNTHGDTQAKLKNAKNKDLNKVYFDVVDGKVKRLRKIGKDFKFEIIEDIDTFKEAPPPPGGSEAEKRAREKKQEEDIKKRYGGLYLPEIIEKVKEKDKEIPFGGTGA